MKREDELSILREAEVPPHGETARERARNAALAAYDAAQDIAPAQGSAGGRRLTAGLTEAWRAVMQKRMLGLPAVAGLAVLPIAGYATWQLMNETGPFVGGETAVRETAEEGRDGDAVAPVAKPLRDAGQRREAAVADSEREEDRAITVPETEMQAADPSAQAPMASPPPAAGAASEAANGSTLMKRQTLPAGPAPADVVAPPREMRDRVETFDSNPVRSALEDPVSTFSVDVDTASYSYVRRSLREGVLPDRDAVRVEEMINYFPYDWPGPADAATPFNTTVTVMPTPWNVDTRLMHVAIEGYELVPAERPASNLVFLIDTSGSMSDPDKLPLLKTAFRLLVAQLTDKDTVSIVTYAGSAGTVLEPTNGAEKAAILAALDRLESGGSTAGAAGIEQAYRLAEQSFVEGGVNRVMLATDGDFNVGPSSDEELQRLIEDKRESGVFLSVFGFGRGNLNDRMMQAIAQNGNGTAAYIDTLAEAEKTLVQEAGATLFPIAKDVKIQVEFNPDRVAEYRLIGYETRSLAREDFNNDRVDAGEIGAGHSVTAIYEVTPKGSPAVMIDDLRYGGEQTDATRPNSDEYAFVKIRYKLPDEDESRLITQPVTDENAIDSFDAAGTDQRFSVAVAAFGQKLRDADQTASFDYERIIEIATAARGSDPYGYRAEFLSLVRLASALAGER